MVRVVFPRGHTVARVVVVEKIVAPARTVVLFGILRISHHADLLAFHRWLPLRIRVAHHGGPEEMIHLPRLVRLREALHEVHVGEDDPEALLAQELHAHPKISGLVNGGVHKVVQLIPLSHRVFPSVDRAAEDGARLLAVEAPVDGRPRAGVTILDVLLGQQWPLALLGVQPPLLLRAPGARGAHSAELEEHCRLGLDAALAGPGGAVPDRDAARHATQGERHGDPTNAAAAGPSGWHRRGSRRCEALLVVARHVHNLQEGLRLHPHAAGNTRPARGMNLRPSGADLLTN
mmetsp:Transcript_67607/g.121900  ORF Transcript_67607/g.121900 Transcript_67607/m.121900 type:complete len:290 (+) Transcript_67607:1807-2676(+)